MARCRLCTSNDDEAVIEHLAEKLWDSRIERLEGPWAWKDAGATLAGRVPRDGSGSAAGVDQRLTGPVVWQPQRRRPACLKRPAPDRSRADGAIAEHLTARCGHQPPTRSRLACMYMAEHKMGPAITDRPHVIAFATADTPAAAHR
jgi:hypothetical protein